VPLSQAIDDLPGGSRAAREAWLRARGLVIPSPWKSGAEMVVWGDVLVSLRALRTATPERPRLRPVSDAPRADDW
jgi:hypothetical protein